MIEGKRWIKICKKLILREGIKKENPAELRDWTIKYKGAVIKIKK